MQEAVQFSDCRGNGLGAAFKEKGSGADRPVARAETGCPPGGWLSKMSSALPRINGARERLEFVAKRALSAGWTRRIYLAEGGRISCLAGKVWITLDQGGEDIVLAACETRNFGPRTRMLLEALAPSQISLEAL